MYTGIQMPFSNARNQSPINHGIWPHGLIDNTGMPRTTKTQTQADILYAAETLMAASILLEDDPDEADLLLGSDSEDEGELLHDNVAELLDISALNWMAIAQRMTGDGFRGTYDQIPKSADFFSVCLRAPDREFRHMFR
ncbi:hypothetical protein GGX14DRAFT_383754 [Mycena pura]|uniref:Uncharacterized protein n=1 Tax=Mycena pura TaxID=153505 RepID=A0AAD6YUU3_9AGAR|nr:hypothetical protein GGX14DRAFT_383748 [Mycena pura]KAJ7229793.1 hypothetical protein GGX14DRAFT_383754 [Mycena pura]